MGSQKPPKRRLSKTKRRALLVLISVTLGVVCRLLPEQYQGPCSAVTKVVAIFGG